MKYSQNPADAREDGLLLPGVKPVLELLESAPGQVDMVFVRKGRRERDSERILDLCQNRGVRFSLVDGAALNRVYPGPSQGVVARLFPAGYVDPEEMLGTVMEAPLPLLLALDQVQDPGNAGTLVRTLYALGGAGLIVPRHNAAYLGAAAAKASAGAMAKLPVGKAANLGRVLDAAAEQGITIYGAAVSPGQSGSSLPNRAEGKEPCKKDYGKRHSDAPVVDIFGEPARLPAVLVLGGEEGGLRAGTLKRCDFLASVPMLRPWDSLNVAQAGAILIGWFARSLLKR